MRKLFVLLGALALMLMAVPAVAQSSGASVSVIHGIPGVAVDVFVNGDETLSDFEPGDVAGPLELPAGDYDIAISPADAGIDGAILTPPTISVTDGLNASIVAHLDDAGDPKVSVFVNDVSAIAAGEARVIVRHTAFAPAVDVFAGDSALFTDVTNPAGGTPGEGVADVPAGTYPVAIAPAGAGLDAAVFGPTDLDLPEGTARIVYATGDLAGGTFELVLQDITGLGSSPGSVPTGTGSLPAGMTAWFLVAASLIALAGAGVLATRKSRA